MARDLDLNLARGDSAGTNSVRIPQINQQKVVSQTPNSPRMQAPQISNDIGRALSGVGGALNDASRAAQIGAQVDNRIQEFQVQQEKEKQTLAVQKAVSESSLLLTSHFDEMKDSAEPGATGFTTRLTKNIDTHIEEATKDATPYYKKQYEANMIGVRQHLLMKGQDYEYGEGLKLEVSNVTKGVEDSQKLVYADPALMENELKRWDATIDSNSRFNPEAKRKMKEDVRKQLVWAAGAKEIEGNPAAFNAALNSDSPRNNPNAGKAATISDLKAKNFNEAEWEKRPDGTQKGKGFLGVLQRPDGGVMTEYSISMDGVNGGKDFPVLVPTLTRAEVETVLKAGDNDKLPKSITDKAAAFAEKRIKEGKPVFAQPGEEGDIISAAPASAPQSAATITLPKDVALPAGLRNNNPGNIKYARQKDAIGPSKNLDQGDPQAVYATPEDGLAAMFTLLLKKFNGGKNTVSSIITSQGGWTPGYTPGANNVAKTMGVNPNDPIDLRDPATLAKFGRALIKQEQGAAHKYITDDAMSYVAQSVLSGRRVQAASRANGPQDTATPTAQATPVKIGKPWYDMATFDEQQKFRQYAEQQNNKLETALNKQRQEIATSLELETRNVSEMVSRGVAPEGQPKTLTDFQAAYATPERAAQAYAGYKTAWDTATTTAKYNSTPTAELVNVIKETPPSATDPDFAIKSNAQQVRQKAAVDIITARQKDPWGYAQATQDFNPGMADPSKKDFGDVIKKRAAALPQLMDKYGVKNATVLSEAETANLANAMGQMPADDRVAMLKTLRQNIGNDQAYATVLNALRPDSPVTVMAGNIAAIGSTVKIGDQTVSTDKIASRIARGEDLLNPRGADKKSDGTKAGFPMPKENEMRTEWVSRVGTAYAGFPDAEAHAYQTYRAYYASRAAEKGIYDGTSDSAIQKEAIDAATGGIGKMDPNGLGNSYKLILPYGMPQDVFNDKATAQWKVLGPQNGYKRTEFGDIRLSPTGENGRYLVTGSDNQPLAGYNNKPIVLDLLAPIMPTPRRDR